MPRIETWEYIIAALSALALIYTTVVRPMWRAFKRLGLMADLFLGDKDKNLPSLPEKVDALRAELHAHVQTYHVPAPGSRAAPQGNGQHGRHGR